MGTRALTSEPAMSNRQPTAGLPPPSRDVVGSTVEGLRGATAQPSPHHPDLMLLSYLQALQHERLQNPESTAETG